MARQEFVLTDTEYRRVLVASQPVPYMVFGGHEPRSPQENANDAWCAIGRARGFDGMTVKPAIGKSDRFFTANPVSPSPAGGETK